MQVTGKPTLNGRVMNIPITPGPSVVIDLDFVSCAFPQDNGTVHLYIEGVVFKFELDNEDQVEKFIGMVFDGKSSSKGGK